MQSSVSLSSLIWFQTRCGSKEKRKETKDKEEKRDKEEV